ncbi:hypothetical protein MNB_SV-15-321 [hydrothermal vent metagenome]|uniref:Putative restriction endonuclease domain-containing protein n=1 Tax=hydrothermal vent metagenome TaxID=652676 RepID=A0A1W1EIE2_9ZZZZ
MGALRDELPHYTYDDYKIWEGNWELIDGIPYAMAPSPIFEHQDISGNIHIELKSKLKKCKNCRSALAVDWVVSDDTVVCPDNSVVCGGFKTKFITTTPKIIFEVLSPSTKRVDRNRKYNLFQEEGVEYYILVEPKGSFAEVYKLENGFYKLQGEFSDEKFIFELDDCKIKFDFENIFED